MDEFIGSLLSQQSVRDSVSVLRQWVSRWTQSTWTGEVVLMVYLMMAPVSLLLVMMVVGRWTRSTWTGGAYLVMRVKMINLKRRAMIMDGR